ncbi:MAG TPA: hypothetical protein PLA50_13270, partial [Bacteroidia bacterium]|nr:hypothetical protein [Bacteroidia bacterium]
MSKAHRRTKRKRQETGALQILEEAFHLVRSADIKAIWIFYLGAVPWSVGLLFFVADMGRSSFAQRDAGLAVGGMVVLWLWMKYTQARYCAMLWDRLSPGHLPNPRKMDRLRALAAYWLLEAFQIPLVVVGCFFAVPLGWVLAMERNFVVLALTQKPGPTPLRSLLGRSIRYSHEQWVQNHAILVVLFFVALFTWVNLFATAVFLPDLIKMAFGVDSVFTLSPQAAMLNSTFLLGTLLLVQLAVVPLMNAAYVLRCFYASSRTSGADLLSRLAACRESWTEQERRERGPLGSKVAAISLLLICLQAGSLRAEEATVAPVAPVAEQRTAGSGGDSFRREIDRTLEQKKYQWRLSRRQIEQGAMPEETWLGRQLKDIAESVKRAMKALEEWIGKNMRRLFERGSPGQKGDPQKGKDLFEKIGSTASVALVVLILGLLVWLTVSLYRKYRGREVEEVAETGRG